LGFAFRWELQICLRKDNIEIAREEEKCLLDELSREFFEELNEKLEKTLRSKADKREAAPDRAFGAHTGRRGWSKGRSVALV
jgi:hypothetical protein